MAEEYDVSAPVDDRALWACALQMVRRYGSDASRVIAERIGALAISGDDQAVSAWIGIAHRLDMILAEDAGIH